jgi:hypothetical protein
MRGFLKKMTSRLNDPVDYYLPLDNEEYHLNPYIGTRIQLTFHQRIRCQHCGKASRKSYGQGYCYPCFKRLARCDLCMMSPERCHFDAGTCREPEWATGFCMQNHIVYLANSSGIKVGITTKNNTPTRWIDQGAVQAVPVLQTSTRQVSGFAEVMFKQHVTDKTQWQRMLKADDPLVDLIQIRDELMQQIAGELTNLQNRFGIQALQPLPDATVQNIKYPVKQYPTKVISMSFDKTERIEGILLGIKGQYLIFDTGVINLRRFTSYEIEFNPGAQP